MPGTVAAFDDVSFDYDRDRRRVFLPIGRGAFALAAFTTWVSAWALIHARDASVPDIFLTRATPATAAAPAPAAKLALSPYGAIFDPGFSSSRPFGEVFDPRFFADVAPRSLASDFPLRSDLSLEASLEVPPPTPSSVIAQPQSPPLPPSRELDQNSNAAPLPPVRPAEFGALAPTPAHDHSPAQSNERSARPAAAADNRTFFEKLFGLGQQSGTTVVAATPPGRSAVKAALPVSATVSGYDRWTAVYDISARTVYLPDGTRLEAHSGLGDRLDDVRYVSERLRGPTPPHLYALQPREASFHGVQALRLLPIGQGDLFGRAGLLAHSYMLGPNGDSNGCVSFRDYDAFLKAYQSGQVKRLAVVARLG
jgi:Protein of unknown function (DUF2778)